VLHIERGNLLLVGMGGSGRRSLLQMGCFVALRSLTVTVDHHHWVPELQRVLKQCTTPTVLALRDSQLLSDEMVEQVTILLNTGEVPPPPEKKITEVENNNNPNPRKHLHVVLCMSPTSFRQRLRQFPSLTNSCYIDWFLEWPQESLRSIALQFLPT
jgi:dynein heavy chain